MTPVCEATRALADFGGADGNKEKWEPRMVGPAWRSAGGRCGRRSCGHGVPGGHRHSSYTAADTDPTFRTPAHSLSLLLTTLPANDAIFSAPAARAVPHTFAGESR